VRRALALWVTTAALAAAPAAQGADYTLRARGSSTGAGTVTAIGDFKPQANATVGAAIRVFGTPSSIREESGSSSCPIGWRTLGLRIYFVNLGGGSACDTSLGRAQSASVFGRRWRTSRGLNIGDSTRRLRGLYPRALRRGRTYRLVGAKSPFGSGRRYSVLAAKTRNGRVGSFKLFIGAAGE
jgi:hypothetical protein